MTPESWQQIEELCQQTLQLKADERSAFLAEVCRDDPALRQQIESLLAHEEEAKDFIETPALVMAVPSLTAREPGWLEGQTLTIGTKLAHYEIKGHLGSGGMGDVYRATDGKLGRSVAIKIIPQDIAHDTERASQLKREARILASLNHPNIAAIYGLEEFEGRNFLVMELVAGETLAERIARGPMALEEVLGVARQIAEALEAAHEEGVVHRDLKPANLKLMPDGKVKVLDFGLAKTFKPSRANLGLSDARLTIGPPTNARMIFGTSGYMSPEQTKGQSVDRRCDIFSFGCVLYEMLTGVRTFSGDTFAETLTAVLSVEPDWTLLPEHTPASIKRLLRRCLHKDRNRRLQHIADACIEIDESQIEAEGPEQLVASRGSSHAQRLPWVLVVMISLASLILVVAAVRYWRDPGPAETAEMRVDVVTPATADSVSFAISPDAHRLAFVASKDGVSFLWVRRLNSATAAQPLTGTEGASYPFWSPDSRSVGFFASGKLKRVDIDGGLPQTLADAALGRGGAWSPDGLILFAPEGAGPLYRVPASGGDSIEATKVQPPQIGSHRFPNFLPFTGGRRQFLFYGYGTTPDVQGIYIGSLDSLETRRLTAADTAGAYMPGGWLVFIRQGTLVARRIDLEHDELTGDPVKLADNVNFETTLYVGAFSISRTGIVAYRSGGASWRQLTWFDRGGKVLGTLGMPNQNNPNNPEVSPDGRRVALDSWILGKADVWIVDADRTTRFTSAQEDNEWAIWSPDGRQIVFDSSRRGPPDLYLKPSNGATAEELLLETPQTKGANDWSSDGKFILYSSLDPKTGQDLWVLPMTGERKPQIFLKTVFDERNGQFSPDRRWIAYESNESGQSEVYVRPFPGPGGQWQISAGGGVQPRWKSDGRELYYIALNGKLMAAPIALQADAVEPGTPLALFPTRGVVTTARQQYDVAPDGRFLFNVEPEDATQSITLLLNWKPAGK